MHSIKRNNLLLAVLATMLQGCINLDPYGVAETNAFPDSDAILLPIREINAGTLLYKRESGFGGVSGQTYSLGYAAGVAARGNDIYVVDQAAGQLVHINMALGEARVLTSLQDPGTHGVYVTQDRTVYVVDKFARAVRQLDDTGQTRRLLADRSLTLAPVDVAETDWGNTIVIADAFSNQLVMFDALHGAYEVIGSNAPRPAIARSVHAIAATMKSVYVLDAEMGEVLRFGLRGNQTGTYGEDDLQMPTALAVDRCGRLFVADRSGQGILVSLSDMASPAARAGQDAFVAEQITDLWVDDDFLYVAAGARGIMIFRIEPPCAAL